MTDVVGGGMSDNTPVPNIDLRTRIAAAVATHADYIAGGIRHCICGDWSGDSQTTRIGFAAHVADAVIAEMRSLMAVKADEYVPSYAEVLRDFIDHILGKADDE